MRKILKPEDFRRWVNSSTVEDAARIHYCYQLGSTFTNMALMEDTIISLMNMCNKISVNRKLGADAKRWEIMLERRSNLQSQTLGKLVQILKNHGLKEEDIKYIEWIKKKRDYFTHRFFQTGSWPGDMDIDDCEAAIRQLLYLEKIFHRFGLRFVYVLSRAGLIEIQPISGGGLLVMNEIDPLEILRRD